MECHPVFREPAFAACYDGPFSLGVEFDFIGSASKPSWTGAAAKGMQGPTGVPPFNEEYFEWCALLQSVRDARDRYAMVELGAGYGRWGIRAAVAARRLGISDIRVKLVEAEPQHAQWARENIALNGVGGIVTIAEAAISYSGQAVPFTIDYRAQGLNAVSWYGQAVVDWEASLPDPTGETYFGHTVHRGPEGYGQILVPSLPLEAILDDLDRIDLIDADIQGAEGAMIANSIEALTAKAARVYVGTHSVEIEDSIRAVFSRAGWLNEWDFSLLGERDTPYGKIAFGDGVQSWINRRLA